MVPRNLQGAKNRQLIVERADSGPVPFSVVEDVFKDIAGAKELPTRQIKANKRGLILGDEPIIYVAGPPGRKVSLRNFAGTTEASGPVWMVDVRKLTDNEFDEIKFKR